MLELLSPAGSMDALRAAVQNGADAVYLGLNAFNARRGAKNFTLEELQEAIPYCHVRGVQVHLALNILVSDREMLAASDVIRAAARLGVDAFIVQDLGLVQLIRQLALGQAFRPPQPLHRFADGVHLCHAPFSFFILPRCSRGHNGAVFKPSSNFFNCCLNYSHF